MLRVSPDGPCVPSPLVSDGGGAAGPAPGAAAAGLPEGAVHPVPGGPKAQEQALPAGGGARQGHTGTHYGIHTTH